MAETATSEDSGGSLLKWRLGFRAIVVFAWILILALLRFWPGTGTRAVPMGAFWLFRTVAVVGVVCLIYEIGQVIARRIEVEGVILDAILVLPMFLFWFLVAAATF